MYKNKIEKGDANKHSSTTTSDELRLEHEFTCVPNPRRASSNDAESGVMSTSNVERVITNATSVPKRILSHPSSGYHLQRVSWSRCRLNKQVKGDQSNEKTQRVLAFIDNKTCRRSHVHRVLQARSLEKSTLQLQQREPTNRPSSCGAKMGIRISRLCAR